MCARLLSFRSLLLLIAVAVALPLRAHAAPQWSTRIALPDAANSVALGPDGVGLLFGFNAAGKKRVIVRPLGGPLGSPQLLPDGLNDGFGSAPFAAWFPDGSALIAQSSSGRVAFRPAGAAAAIGDPKFVSGFGVAGIAPLASGDALLASTTTVKVAPRPAGAASEVDPDSVETIASGTLIGVVQDPGGGAVVVFTSGNVLSQAVRAPGESTFGDPTEISAPGLGPLEFRVRMASSSNGYAVLGWLGNSPSSTSFGDTIVAAFRAPGGAFGTPISVATTPVEDATTVLPAVTTSGDGLVAWTSLNALSQCDPPRDHDFGAYYAYGRGGGWSGAIPLGGIAYPNGSGVDAVASEGDHIAIAYFTETHTGARCAGGAVTRELLVTTATSGPQALAIEGSTPIAESHVISAGTQQPAFGQLAVNAEGGVFATFAEGDGSGLYPSWLRVREDLEGVPTATPTPGAVPTPTPTATVAVPPHVAAAGAAKAVDKCADGIAKAGGKLLKNELATFHKCAAGFFACLQTKEVGAKRDACTAKAKATCDALTPKAIAAQAAFVADVGTRCGAIDDQDVTSAGGLGFGGLSATCAAGFGGGVTGSASAADCVRNQHQCSVAALLSLVLPRTYELLALNGVTIPGCLEGTAGAGLGVADVAVGKSLAKCAGTIDKTATGFLGKTLKDLQKCVGGVFACVQLKSDAAEFPACLAKADTACDKTFAKLATTLAPAIDKTCGAVGAPLLDANGLDLDGLPAVCATYGVASVTSLADYEQCLYRHHRCFVENLLTFQNPRAPELLGLVGRQIPSAFCPGS